MGSLFWVLNVITSVIEKGASGTLDYRREEVVMMETEIGVTCGFSTSVRGPGYIALTTRATHAGLLPAGDSGGSL